MTIYPSFHYPILPYFNPTVPELRNCKRGDLEVTYNQLSCYHEHPIPLPQLHPILSSVTLGFFQSQRSNHCPPNTLLFPFHPFRFLQHSPLKSSFLLSTQSFTQGLQTHKPKTAWPAPLSSTAWPQAPLPRSLQRLLGSDV